MNTSIDQIERHIQYFVNFEPHRHFGNLIALNDCVDYIKSFFSECSMQPRIQSWEVRGNDYHNVIASYNPEKKKRLVVGAHYDVYANNPGADDNASGMAGLLESARMITKAQPNLDYGIDFVAYSLEEPPFFGSSDMGSYVHAESISDDSENVIGMICYDMIGYFNDAPNSQTFPNEALASMFPNTADFILVVGIKEYQEFSHRFFENMNMVNEMDVREVHFDDGRNLAGLSDHRNYWHFGMNALMINNSAFLRNPNYHEKTDTIETLDFDKMKLVIESATAAMLQF